jgi:hypothetical protein
MFAVIRGKILIQAVVTGCSTKGNNCKCRIELKGMRELKTKTEQEKRVIREQEKEERVKRRERRGSEKLPGVNKDEKGIRKENKNENKSKYRR